MSIPAFPASAALSSAAASVPERPACTARPQASDKSQFPPIDQEPRHNDTKLDGALLNDAKLPAASGNRVALPRSQVDVECLSRHTPDTEFSELPWKRGSEQPQSVWPDEIASDSTAHGASQTLTPSTNASPPTHLSRLQYPQGLELKALQPLRPAPEGVIDRRSNGGQAAEPSTAGGSAASLSLIDQLSLSRLTSDDLLLGHKILSQKKLPAASKTAFGELPQNFPEGDEVSLSDDTEHLLPSLLKSQRRRETHSIDPFKRPRSRSDHGSPIPSSPTRLKSGGASRKGSQSNDFGGNTAARSVRCVTCSSKVRRQDRLSYDSDSEQNEDDAAALVSNSKPNGRLFAERGNRQSDGVDGWVFVEGQWRPWRTDGRNFRLSAARSLLPTAQGDAFSSRCTSRDLEATALHAYASGERRSTHTSIPTEEESLDKFSHRVGWLIGLLVVQSTSSFVLQSFKQLIDQHTAVVSFLTMLVGAGGNAGSQSTVLVIRSLALGKLSAPGTVPKFLLKQMKVAFGLASLLFLVSIVRVYLFDGDSFEVLAVGVSLFVIVVTSVFFGSVLPLMLHLNDVDPAHAGAAIQVLMDIVGVTLTCITSHLILNKFAPLINPTYRHDDTTEAVLSSANLAKAANH